MAQKKLIFRLSIDKQEFRFEGLIEESQLHNKNPEVLWDCRTQAAAITKTSTEIIDKFYQKGRLNTAYVEIANAGMGMILDNNASNYTIETKIEETK